MFGKKKEVKRQPRSGGIAQYGIFEVPSSIDDIGTGVMDNDDDDEDLEAELAALTSGDQVERKSRQKAQKPDSVNLVALGDVIKDMEVDDDVSEGDENDPELLDELKIITGDESVSPEEGSQPESASLLASPDEKNDDCKEDILRLLEERLELYQKAETKAIHQNETSKARRFNRGIKTLQHMIKDAHNGHSINEADIPPPLPPSATSDVTEQPSLPVTDTNTSPSVPEVPESDASPKSEEQINSEPAAAPQVNEEALVLLKQRQQEYKVAALACKKAGNMQEALQYVKVAKQFDIVIAAVAAGETIDLSDMPPSPTGSSTAATSTVPPSPPKEEAEIQQQSDFVTPAASESAEQRHGVEDIGSALKERLEVYRRTKTAAESEGNSSKARRYGRICKQFEDALKLHARGRPVPLDELPVPPGFPPLSAAPQNSGANAVSPVREEEKPEPKSTPSKDNSPNSPAQKSTPTPPPRANLGKKIQKASTRAEKQLAQLLQRQRELKQAALKAKTDGDLDLARDYLRQAKGIQPLIEASKGGLPVDMSSIPLSPLAKVELSSHGISAQSNDSFQLVFSEDCTEENGANDGQIYENLEKQLIKQIKWCLSTRDHSKALGDVPGYNRWERLALGYTRDLDMLRVRKRDALPPPLHHYEMKTYAIVQSCTDLNDNDIEISIIRGINYAREADTYVIFEFPYPTDSPTTDRTSTIKGACNPEYEAVFPLNGILDRNSRQCQRAFKRHALKCQVWAKGGFFRSDSLLGTVTVKLQPLETQCILHDSFPLMEGRKPTGGKLEIKMRLRNPILTKQIEQVTDKWLIIDH